MGTSSKLFICTWRLLPAVALLALGPVAVSVAQPPDPIVGDDDDQGLVWDIEQANKSGQEIHPAEDGDSLLTDADNTTCDTNGLPVLTGTVPTRDGATIARGDGSPEFRVSNVAWRAASHLHAVTDRNSNASSEGAGNSGGGIWIINGIATPEYMKGVRLLKLMT
jgi:hypothetical protein